MRIAAIGGVPERKGTQPVFLEVQQSMLGVPDDEPEPIALATIHESVPVVPSAIVAEPADGSIQVTAVEDYQHVIDEIDRI